MFVGLVYLRVSKLRLNWSFEGERDASDARHYGPLSLVDLEAQISKPAERQLDAPQTPFTPRPARSTYPRGLRLSAAPPPTRK